VKPDPQTLDLFGALLDGAEVAPQIGPLPVDEAEPDDVEALEDIDPPAELEPALETEVRLPKEPKIWSVTEVNRSVREMLEDYLPPLWVSGEVANWTAHRSGHRYFTLKDDSAQIRCVMWGRDARRLPIDPENGMNVKVFGGLTLYEVRGEYQLAVRQLEAQDAEGLWRLAFEKLRKKLDAEGLLDPRRKRPLPRYPRAVGIVTSATGAALRDMLTVIRRRAPWTRVVVRSCRVQGEGAAVDVADAIRVLAASGRADVLIVGRGGGSIEDLWAFNEEAVARAIAACPLPVISAVGHEIDVTIADLVADHRAPTPTAAAEAAVPDAGQLADALRVLPTRLGRALRGAVERRGRRIVDAGARLERGMRGRIAPPLQRIARSSERLTLVVERRLERRRRALGAAAGKLDALSPLATLKRGYAVALGEGGHVLRRTEDFEPGLEFDLRVMDGTVRCEAQSTERQGS
jgi:exodeoxyribonuclease VII large subunit